MLRFLISLVLTSFVGIWAVPVSAQDDEIAWVQIEAQPGLEIASDRIRAYSRQVQDVNGFALGGGWYAVALGPYTRPDAETVLRSYRRDGLIPRDAFIAFSSAYQRQFWPVGANLLDIQAVDPEGTDPIETTEVVDDAPETELAEVEPEPVVVPDETPREARRSEAQLSRDEKKDLQIALQWGGYYNSGIDGAFGRGTRNSMSAWQADNGFEPTGVLTTLQRATLFRQYNAVLEGLGLATVTDADAGIEMVMPTEIVGFAKYEAPFAHYDGTGEIDGARLLLISQPGDQTTLFGLYDIMQTLEIVPLDGPRERKRSSFTLEGENDDIISYTQASLEGGEIKGFTLIWPTGDEERRTRMMAELRKSFTRIPGVLDPAAGDDTAQSVDLIAGLEVRKPILSRTGFYTDSRGTVVTTAEAVAQCTRITLDREVEAEMVLVDDALGVAVLRPTQTLAPIEVAAFSGSNPRLQSDIAVAGFSFEGVLGAPTLTFGKLADLRGLDGEETLARLALAPLPGDAGGPVFDAGGGVMGMLLPKAEGTSRRLPEDVSFAADADAISAVLAEAGLSPRIVDTAGAMAPEDLTTRAYGMTVLVSCWD